MQDRALGKGKADLKTRVDEIICSHGLLFFQFGRVRDRLKKLTLIISA